MNILIRIIGYGVCFVIIFTHVVSDIGKRLTDNMLKCKKESGIILESRSALRNAQAVIGCMERKNNFWENLFMLRISNILRSLPNTPFEYVGVWYSSQPQCDYKISLHLNGEFTAEPVRCNISSDSFSGSWGIHENQIVWLYNKQSFWPPDINAIESAGPNSFVLVEKNGSRTKFTRAEDEAERITAFWEIGEIAKALELADMSLSDSNVKIAIRIIEVLESLGSEKAIGILEKHLNSASYDIRMAIASALVNIGSDKAIELLIALLEDRDEYVRNTAAAALGKIRSEKSIEPLIALLEDQDEDANLRSSAVNILGVIGSEKSVEPLIAMLKDQNENMRSSAAWALGNIRSDKAVEPLIAALKDENVRDAAADALGKIGSDKAVEPLIALLKDQDENVRNYAVNVLSAIGSEKAVEPLIALLKDQDEKMRSHVASSLGNIYYKGNRSEKCAELLTDLLKDQDADLRKNAASALVNIGSEKDMVALLKDQDVDVRWYARKALLYIVSEKSVEPLTALLEDQNVYARSNAAYVLGAMVSKTDMRGNTAYDLKPLVSEKSVKPLTALLKDKFEGVRRNAEWALVKIGSEKSVELLTAALKDQDEYMRSMAASALVKIASEKSVAHVIALLKDQNANVRNYAVEALGNLGSDKAIEPLIAMLKDQDENMRRASAYALGKIGSDKAVEPLIAALNDQNEHVRSNAAHALKEIGSEKALIALGNIGSEESFENLIAALKNQDKNVKKVHKALGKISSEKAVEPLIALLNDQNEYVRMYAAEALGNIGSEKAVEPLIAMLKDQSVNVRKAVTYALGKIGSEKSVEPLIALLNVQDEHVRIKAAEALGNIGSEKSLEPLTALLNFQRMPAVLAVGKLSDDKKTTDAIAKIYAEPKEEPDVRLAAACVLLKHNLIDEGGLKLIRSRIESREAEHRKQIADFLGRVPSKQGTAFLISMLNDKNQLVREEVVIALAKSGFSETFEPLKAIAINKQKRVRTRIAAIAGLGKIKSDESVNLLTDILEKDTETYQFRAIQALGNTGSQKAVTVLLKHLQTPESRKPEAAYLECELAYAISRIAPETEGIKLLNHNSAAVREGAWLGIGQVGTVELLKKLYEERRGKDISPWFRHAAYRAIDHVLIHIEIFGNTKDADELEKFLAEVSEKDEPGVHTRTKWTIDRLKNPIRRPLPEMEIGEEG